MSLSDANFMQFMWADPLVFAILTFGCIGGFLFGIDQGLLSALLRMESFGAQFPRVYMDPDYKGWCVSAFLLSAWFGALCNSPIIEKYGRRDTIMVACVVFSIGGALQSAGINDAMMFAGRAVSGIAVGSLTTTVPILLSEFTPPKQRGGLVVCQQVLITFGILVAYWLGYGTNFIGGTTCAKEPTYEVFNPYTDVPEGGCDGQSSASWRIPLAFQIIPAIILGTGMCFMPKSPRWLLLVGRESESWDTLKYLRRKFEDDEVEQEFLEMKAEVEFERDYAIRKYGPKSGLSLELSKYAMLFTTKSHFRRVFIGSAVMFFQQFLGCNAIIYYAPTIFAALGLSDNTTSLLGTGLYGIVNFLATIPAIFLIDRVGRKPLLMCGAAGCFISLIIVAGIVGKYDDQLATYVTPGRTAIAFIFIYDVNFSYSFAPIGWVLPSEIFPIGIRAKAVSITTSSTWMCNFIIGLVTPRMLETMKFGTYLFFGVFAFMAFFFVWFCIPETKGRPLEEMDEVFNDIEAATEKQALADAHAKVKEMHIEDAKPSVDLSV